MVDAASCPSESLSCSRMPITMCRTCSSERALDAPTLRTPHPRIVDLGFGPGSGVLLACRFVEIPPNLPVFDPPMAGALFAAEHTTVVVTVQEPGGELR